MSLGSVIWALVCGRYILDICKNNDTHLRPPCHMYMYAYMYKMGDLYFHKKIAMPIIPYFQCLTSLPSYPPSTIITYILEPNTIFMVCLKCHLFRNILAITVFAIGISNIYGINLFY